MTPEQKAELAASLRQYIFNELADNIGKPLDRPAVRRMKHDTVKMLLSEVKRLKLGPEPAEGWATYLEQLAGFAFDKLLMSKRLGKHGPQ